ncbi:MAG TPA: hypothetical protein VJT67_11315 [Longimicrobiaceae bacterium]|nr:hypothetical protein [Longimicrobiaceae bacterium]
MSRVRCAAPEVFALLEDGSLALSADPRTLELLEGWLPRAPRRRETHGGAAWIHVDPGAEHPVVPEREPDLQLFGVRGWVLPAEERVVLADVDGRIGARIDLAARSAEVGMDPGPDPPDQRDVFATLTIAAALLLGRLGRTLVHAAAVVDPGGSAWLLPARSFGGKSTTCITLIQAGWNYLSDDHVILTAGDGAVHAEGWPRPFNLDVGYAAGVSAGVRARTDPGGLGPGRWQSSAPVAGLLFPRVEAELPTALSPLHPAGALTLLLGEAPALLADPATAPEALALLTRVASRLPAYELRLGADCYCNSDRLQFTLREALCIV